METDDIPNKTPSLWIPMTNPGDVAVVGKLQEELGELTSILARCLIQGLYEHDPETGKPNILSLEDEIADLMAMSTLLIDRFGLNLVHIHQRKAAKIDYKRQWFNELDEKWPPPIGRVI